MKTEYEKQPKRDRQLKQLDYLTEQGIFNASTGAIKTTDGEREVRRYRLTWQGALNMGKRGGSTSICLTYGRKAFGEIKSIVKQQQQYKAGDVYNVINRRSFPCGKPLFCLRLLLLTGRELRRVFYSHWDLI